MGQDPVWDAPLILDESEKQVQDFMAKLEEFTNQCAKDEQWDSRQTKYGPLGIPKKKNLDGEKVPMEGKILLKAKRKVERQTRTGERMKASPPVIYDVNAEVVSIPITVGSGSIARLEVAFIGYVTPTMAGVTCRLEAVQIKELKERFYRPTFDALEIPEALDKPVAVADYDF